MYISFTNELILIPITDYNHNKVENRFEKNKCFACFWILLYNCCWSVYTGGYTNNIYYIYFPNVSSTPR
jgi:hypothetical protein